LPWPRVLFSGPSDPDMENGVRTARVYHFGAFTGDAPNGDLLNAGCNNPLSVPGIDISRSHSYH